MTKPSLTDELRQLLPQELRDAPPVQRVAELEQAAARAQTEREFLERAPREGLLYPADALKLEDLHACLGKAPDRATGLNEYFAALREPALAVRAHPGCPDAEAGRSRTRP